MKKNKFTNILKKAFKLVSYATIGVFALYVIGLSIIIPYYIGYLENFKPASSEKIVAHYQLRGDNPLAYDFEYEDIIFETEDGIKLSGWFIESEQQSNRCIYMIHGWKSSGVACLFFLDIIKEYSLNKEHNIFIINLRNSGNSSKIPSDLGYKTSKDVFEGMKFLKQKQYIDSIKIFAISMGAMAATTCLNLYEKRIKDLGIKIEKVLFDSPLSDAKNAIKSEESIVQFLSSLVYEPFFFVVNYRWDNMLNKLNFSTLMKNIDVSKMLILQSEKDKLTKLSSLKKQIKDVPVEVILFEQGAHARIFQSNKIEYKKVFGEFFLD